MARARGGGAGRAWSEPPGPGPPPHAQPPASPALWTRGLGGGDLGLQRPQRTGMALLGLLQAGGSVLGQAMERVASGSLLSALLVACAFTLSLVYLCRLAVGHLAPLPAGAVRARARGGPGAGRGDLGGRGAEGRARGPPAAALGGGSPRGRVLAWVRTAPILAVSGPGRGRARRVWVTGTAALAAALVTVMVASGLAAVAQAVAPSAPVAARAA